MWLAENYRVEVVGVTLSGVQAARANKYAKKRGLDELVRFEQQDFTDTSFPDASFDVVWAQESVCHVPLASKQAFMKEAYRVLRPGDDLATMDEYAQWAEEAGLKVIGRRDITSHTHRSLRHLWRVALFCYAPGLLMRAVRIRSAIEHGNMRSARLQWPAYKRGLWGIGTLSARK